MNKYTTIIGLEIHVELSTKSKMFCQCDADYFGKEPNSNTCPVCLGMPGALPVPNKQAVDWTIKIGQALNCTINKHTKFDRKHYFYPDLPKGYQISQYDEPIASNGYLDITTPSSLRSATPPRKGEELNNISSFNKEEYPKGEVVKRIRITRVHLEEDTGKLTHLGEDTLVDFNRSSVPLVEIVTEPDFDNSEDVKTFLEELHTIIRYLEVSDADMDKGSMRLEPNISVSSITNYKLRMKNLPNYKVEVKNINSFNFAKKAIDYEVPRHIEILEKGETPLQETRGYNEDKGETYSQRTKEGAADYRYFPEPDIPPIEFTDEHLEEIRKTIPELPAELIARYTKKMKPADAMIISRNKELVTLFEAVDNLVSFKNSSQAIANAIVNKKVSTDLPPEQFAKEVEKQSKPKETDTAKLAEVIEKVIAGNEKAVSDYKGGNKNSIMFLVGQVMKEMRGQADAMLVRGELEKLL